MSILDYINRATWENRQAGKRMAQEKPALSRYLRLLRDNAGASSFEHSGSLASRTGLGQKSKNRRAVGGLKGSVSQGKGRVV